MIQTIQIQSSRIQVTYYRYKSRGRLHMSMIITDDTGNTYKAGRKITEYFMSLFEIKKNILEIRDPQMRNDIINNIVQDADKQLIIDYDDENNQIVRISTPGFTPIRHTELFSWLSDYLVDTGIKQVSKIIDWDNRMFFWSFNNNRALLIFNRNDVRHSLYIRPGIIGDENSIILYNNNLFLKHTGQKSKLKARFIKKIDRAFNYFGNKIENEYNSIKDARIKIPPTSVTKPIKRLFREIIPQCKTVNDVIILANYRVNEMGMTLPERKIVWSFLYTYIKECINKEGIVCIKS